MVKSTYFRIGLHLLLVAALVTLSYSCKKEEPEPLPILTDNPSTGIASIEYKFSGQIDGADVLFSNASIGYNNTNGSSPGSYWHKYAVSLFDDGFTELVRFEKGTLTHAEPYPSNELFDDYFGIGGQILDPTLVNGCQFSVFIGGEEWSTGMGSADQTGSYFEILTSGNGTEGTAHIRELKLGINCKVYNSIGEMKTISNGELICKMKNY